MTPRRLALVADGIPTMREGAGENAGVPMSRPGTARAGFQTPCRKGLESRTGNREGNFFLRRRRKEGRGDQQRPAEYS